MFLPLHKVQTCIRNALQAKLKSKDGKKILRQAQRRFVDTFIAQIVYKSCVSFRKITGKNKEFNDVVLGTRNSSGLQVNLSSGKAL
jgi:hypothetical protein